MSVKSTYGAGDGFVHGTKMADRTGKRSVLTVPRKKKGTVNSLNFYFITLHVYNDLKTCRTYKTMINM